MTSAQLQVKYRGIEAVGGVAININRPQKREFGQGFMLIEHKGLAAKYCKAWLCVSIRPAPMKVALSAIYVEDHRQPPATSTRRRTRS